jgi:hypothetical protein
MHIIQNNPYRTIGLLVGATAAEQRRQLTRLQRILEAEQEPEDDYSFPSLGHIHRTLASVNEASSKLNLDNDKMNAALFWFFKGNPISDEPAFDAIKEGDIDQVINIWTKLTSNGEVSQRNASAYSNLGTLYLSGILEGTNTNETLLEQGISLKLKFLESDFIKDFKALATDETFKVTKKELQLMFLNQVQYEIEKSEEISSYILLDILTKKDFSAKEDFLKGFVQKPIEQLECLLNECKIHRKTKKEDVIVAGTNLYNAARPILIQLKGIIGVSNLKFTSIADKISEEILQCGIQLFNDYKDHKTYDPSEPTMKLFIKAKNFAVGNIAKQRIEENTGNLQEWIDDKVNRELNKKIGDDVEFIIEKLKLAADTLKNKGKYPKGYDDPYSDLPLNEQPHNKVAPQYNQGFNPLLGQKYLNDPFSYKSNEFNINLYRLARDTVKECKPRLDNVKTTLGYSNELYQKLSNDVASITLACLIGYVNNSGNSALGIPPNIDEHEINVMNSIGELEMNSEMRKRYNDQKNALANLHRAVQKRSSSSSSSSSGSSGCYIATMAYGDYEHPQVMILRQFRDEVLDKSAFGKWFIKNYYHYSPKLVEKLKNKKGINAIIRKTLNQFIKLI